MQEIILKTAQNKSRIICGAGAFEKIAKELKGKRLFIITDSNVIRLYSRLIEEKLGKAEVYVFEAGEKSKTPETLINIIKKMLQAGVTRNDTVVAFGGGVVGDVAGLAASLYMRGVPLVQIPTTLLAQVDSSVGGKTAVDMEGVKNVLGTFYQPFSVAADPLFFKTLPEEELRCGLGEIVKYAALDKSIFKKISVNKDRLYSLEFAEEIVFDCIAHKAEIVAKDEKDLTGIRKSLNLGHTTGHALELFYGGKSHGEYVLIGMYFELQIAENLHICGGQYANCLKQLILKALGKIPKFRYIEKAAQFAAHDKKNKNGLISIVVPKSEGAWQEVKLTLDVYADYLKEINGVKS